MATNTIEEQEEAANAEGRLQIAFWDAYDNARLYATGVSPALAIISPTAYDAARAIVQHENNARNRPKLLDLGEKEKPCELTTALQSLRSTRR